MEGGREVWQSMQVGDVGDDEPRGWVEVEGLRSAEVMMSLMEAMSAVSRGETLGSVEGIESCELREMTEAGIVLDDEGKSADSEYLSSVLVNLDTAIVVAFFKNFSNPAMSQIQSKVNKRVG